MEYTITSNNQTIPDDATKVLLDITTEDAVIKLYLPKNPPHLGRIDIYCNNAKAKSGQVSVMIYRNQQSTRYIRSVYKGYLDKLYYNEVRNSWCYLESSYCSDGEEYD